jgi:enoyl-CoA hydratase/carnithine racemase
LLSRAYAVNSDQIIIATVIPTNTPIKGTPVYQDMTYQVDDPVAINGACAGLGFVFTMLTDMRFVERLVEAGESVTEACNYIKELATSTSTTSLKIMKAQVYRPLNMPLGKAMRETND